MTAPVRSSHPARGFGDRSTGPSSWLVAMAVTVSTLIFAVTAMALAQYVDALSGPSLKVRHNVPRLIGMPLTTVRDQASSIDLVVQVVGERPSEQYPRGVIMQQSPVAGWHMGEARVVRVTLSTGLVAPDVVGLTRAEAEAKLIRLGWTPVPIERTAEARVPLQHPAPGVPVDGPGQMSLAFVE
jgi:beta-lactam-binding protein with PASTA domain